MKKLSLLILFFIFVCETSFGAIITGGVEYDYERVQEEAFRAPINNVSPKIIQQFLNDTDEHIKGTKLGIKDFKNCKAAIFSDGSYGIMYINDPLYNWFYNSQGRLISFTQKSSTNYPRRTVKFAPDGSILNIGLQISPEESFIFNPKGILIAHWQGDTCYGILGNVIMTRKPCDKLPNFL